MDLLAAVRDHAGLHEVGLEAHHGRGGLALVVHALAHVEEGVVAVLPFSFRGSDQYEYLGAGMVDLLTTKLDGAGSLRAVGPRAVLGVVRQAGGDLDPPAAEGVARRLRAGLYVLGQVVEVNGRVQLSASVHRVGESAAPVPASVQGDSENIFALVDELAARLLSGLAGGPGARVTGLDLELEPAGVRSHPGRLDACGSGYFSVFELFMPFFSTAVSDRLILSGGTPLLFLFELMQGVNLLAETFRYRLPHSGSNDRFARFQGFNQIGDFAQSPRIFISL